MSRFDHFIVWLYVAATIMALSYQNDMIKDQIKEQCTGIVVKQVLLPADFICRPEFWRGEDVMTCRTGLTHWMKNKKD